MQSPLLLLAAFGACIVFIHAWNNGVGYLIVLLVPLSWVAVHFYHRHAPNIRKGSLLLKASFLRWRGSGKSGEDVLRQAAIMPWVHRTATIKRDLEKKLDQVLRDGGTLTITGGDGYPVAKASYGWERHLKEFLDRGCQVTQYVVCPTEEAEEKFRSLEKAYNGNEQGQGRFIYKKLSAVKASDQEGQRFVEGLMTYHPTLASNVEGDRMLWIEGHHPPRSTRATECEYYSPKDLKIAAGPYLEHENLLKEAEKYVE